MKNRSKTSKRAAAAPSASTGSTSSLWNYAAALGGIVNTTTAVTIAAAAGSGLKNYITGYDVTYTALTNSTELAIRDGAGGTVLYRTWLPVGGPCTSPAFVQFDPAISGTANTLMEVVTLTATGAASAVWFNARGYTSQ